MKSSGPPDEAAVPAGRRAPGRTESSAPTTLRVAMVVMPFASTLAPSIQAGLLQSLTRRAGHVCDSFYFNLDTAAVLGVEPYEQLAHLPLPLIGEWLFSTAAFGAQAPDPEEGLLGDPDMPRLEARLGLSHAELSRFRCSGARALVERWIREERLSGYDVVGFSSVFQQTVPAIALARRLKEVSPHTVVVFGGANVQGEMGRELVRSIPWIDYAALGESDDSFPALLAAIAKGEEPSAVANIASKSRSGGGVGRLTTALDQLPTPDYRDYFARARSLGLATSDSHLRIELPVEASRGCWWGAKHHCTFCGLDPAAMTFRRKSAERIIAEMTELAQTSATFRFLTTDAIVDLGHLKTLFPALAEAGFGFELFFELKSNLGRDHLRTLREGGVTRIQPGIESLSSGVLALIEKGVTAIQNVNFLRWSRYYGFAVDWNVLWGFPGENEEMYAEMARTVRRLHHLPPPANAGPVQMHRFSPMFRDRARFPVRYKRAEKSYRYAFPRSVDHDAIAYYFDYEFDCELPRHGHDLLEREIEAWRTRWEEPLQPRLSYRFAPDLVVIDDTRDRARTSTCTLRGALANLYEACSDRPRALDGLVDIAPHELRRSEIAEGLDELVARGLMMRERDQYLSLALPAGVPR